MEAKGFPYADISCGSDHKYTTKVTWETVTSGFGESQEGLESLSLNRLVYLVSLRIEGITLVTATHICTSCRHTDPEFSLSADIRETILGAPLSIESVGAEL